MLLFSLVLLSLAITFWLHFSFAQKFVKKDKIYFGFVMIVITSTLSLLLSLNINTTSRSTTILILLLPSIYISNLLFFRYILFNRITYKLNLHNIEPPFNPNLMMPGAIFVYCVEKGKSSILELLFSVWILIAPFVWVLFLDNL